MSENLIYGKNTILEALKSSKRTINKIIINKSMHHDSKLDDILDIARNRGIIFNFVPKDRFNKYFDEKVNHQGIIAQVSPIEYMDLNIFLQNKPNRYIKLLILDGILDPYNLGSIIRTCVCAKYDGIIIPKRRSAQINSTVEKTSSGAINHIPIIQVNSLISAINTLKNNDIWIIATTPCAKDNYFEIDYSNMNFAIIMGSEGEGIKKTLLEQSDFKVKIPMLCNFNSLNVSNTTSIIVYESIREELLQNFKK